MRSDFILRCAVPRAFATRAIQNQNRNFSDRADRTASIRSGPFHNPVPSRDGRFSVWILAEKRGVGFEAVLRRARMGVVTDVKCPVGISVAGRFPGRNPAASAAAQAGQRIFLATECGSGEIRRDAREWLS